VKLFEVVKEKMAESAERRRQERDFTRKHKLKKDPDLKNRWWLDDLRYVDADLSDPDAREAVEEELGRHKRRPKVRAATEGKVEPRKKGAKKTNDFELRPFDFNAPMPWDAKKPTKKKA
jgi:hypothetical protein